MASVIGAVAAAAATAAGASAAVAGTIGAIATAVGSFLAKSLFGSRKQRNRGTTARSAAQKTRGRSTVIKSSVESWNIIYGRQRSSGPLAHVATTGNDNDNAHLIVPIAGHKIHDIEDVFIDDVRVALNDEGQQGLDWQDGVRVSAKNDEFTLGDTEVETKTEEKEIKVQGTNGDGSVNNLRIEAEEFTYSVVGGTISLDGGETGTDITSGNLAVTIAQDFPGFAKFFGAFIVSRATVNSGELVTSDGDTIEVIGGSLESDLWARSQIYDNNTLGTYDATGDLQIEKTVLDSNGDPVTVVTNPSQKLLYITPHYGRDDQQADQDAVANIPEWTNDHRGRGIAYLYLEFKFKKRKWPNGLPQNIKAIIKGKEVYDPRDDTVKWTDNWALCVRDYIVDERFGLNASVDESTVIQAANVSDEDIPLKDGGTQKRYRLNGMVDTADSQMDILQDMVTASAGAITYAGNGEFRLHVGDYDSPVADIDDSWYTEGGIKVETNPTRNEIVNKVTGVYISPKEDWEPVDFPPVTNSTYLAQDNNEEFTEDIRLPFTQDETRAQRIAKIILEKGRQGIRAKLNCNYKAMQLRPWDVVTITNDYLGWDHKEFRVLNWELDPTGGIYIEAQEESAESYNWDKGEATTIDPAPDTSLSSPFDTPKPLNVTITEILGEFPRIGVSNKITVSWIQPKDYEFISEYVVEIKEQNDSPSNYREMGRIEHIDRNMRMQDQGDITRSVQIFDLIEGTYNILVRAVNTVGVASPPVIKTKEVVGLSEAPNDVTGLTANVMSSNIVLSWDRPTQPKDLDVINGGSYRVKYSKRITGATWNEAIDVDEAPGQATTTVVPLNKSGTYLLKAIDSGGRASSNAATVSIDTKFSDSEEVEQLVTLQEDPDFNGTVNNMVKTASGTVLSDGVDTFDDVSSNFGGATFDNIPGDFDSIGGGYVKTGSYTSAGVIDVRDVFTVRLNSSVNAIAADTNRTWDSLGQTNWDDVPGTWDTGELSAGRLDLEVRITNDDPNSANPSWSPWQRFIAGDFTGRGFQFRFSFNKPNTELFVELDEFRITAELPTRKERFNDREISSTETFSFNRRFYFRPELSLIIQDIQPGDTAQKDLITNSDGQYTGVDITIYDDTGSVATRTVDLIARGA